MFPSIGLFRRQMIGFVLGWGDFLHVQYTLFHILVGHETTSFVGKAQLHVSFVGDTLKESRLGNIGHDGLVRRHRLGSHRLQIRNGISSRQGSSEGHTGEESTRQGSRARSVGSFAVATQGRRSIAARSSRGQVAARGGPTVLFAARGLGSRSAVRRGLATIGLVTACNTQSGRGGRRSSSFIRGWFWIMLVHNSVERLFNIINGESALTTVTTASQICVVRRRSHSSSNAVE
mmetsp:Transcript_24059/g.50025  ORF Transcript_24059/g.50025 Transcript_24059/m.50025 type:complete len:233 (-) Transcript_24059:803-1501(-)